MKKKKSILFAFTIQVTFFISSSGNPELLE